MIKDNWFIYIVKIDNGEQPNRSFYNKKLIYHTGLTRFIGLRIGDYLFRRGYCYINTIWEHAKRELMYVEYFTGSKEEALQRVSDIKKMSEPQKLALFKSYKNSLVFYKPRKAIVLWKKFFPEEQIAYPIK